jgi:ferredoxin-type protein NapH
MKFNALLLTILLITIFFQSPVLAITSQSVSKTDSIGCYTKEQIDLSEIARFRDGYMPKEYNPLSESLVYADMAILLMLLAAGMYFVIKNKPAGWLTWLSIITLFYLGILRGGCICPVGLTTNVIMGIINPFMVSIVGLVIFITPIITALIMGRVFCVSGCPLGAIQHLIFKKRKDIKIPLKVNRFVKVVPVLVLALTVYFAVRGTLYFGCEIDPYKPVFFTGKAWFEQGIAWLIGTPMESRFLFTFGIIPWLYLIVAMVAGYWIQRPFCRLLCPYSAIIGFVSLVSFRKRRIDSQKCTFCSLCMKKCPVQAIIISKKESLNTLSVYDCIQCNRCSEICKTDAITVK